MRNLVLLCLALSLSATVAACRATPERRGDDARAQPSSEEGTSSEAGATDGASVVTAAAGDNGTAATGTDASGTPAGDAVAVVNGEPIALADFQRQAFDTQRFYVEQGLDPNTEDGQRQLLYLRKQVLDDMINQVLIAQAAKEMGITATDEEVAARMKAYLDEFGNQEALDASLSQSGTNTQEIEAMERSSIIGQKLLERITVDVPATAEFVHARHILCQTAQDCEAALARLEAGEAFDAVASEVSTDETSAKRGGDLDWVSRGMLPSQQLEDEIFKLQPGQRSGVVKTDFGYHVIETLERDPSRELSADQKYALREKRLMEWLDQRRQSSDVVINVEDLRDLAATATP
jgi:parvulin-like peptidyl-prolyl isomerase